MAYTEYGTCECRLYVVGLSCNFVDVKFACLDTTRYSDTERNETLIRT